MAILRDLSNNNGPAGLKALADPNTSAFYLKATEGLGFKDPYYAQFRAGAELHRKPSGGYLFLRPDQNGAAQAKAFLAFAKPEPGDLQPVVDVETGAPGAAASVALSALRTLREAGFDPLVYSSSSFLKELVSAQPALKTFRVWDAEYGPVLHRIPGLNYVAWQFTDRLVVGKGPLRTDGSRLFVRSLAALEIPKPKPPVPPTPAPSPTPAPAPAPKPKPKRHVWVVIDGLRVLRGSKLWRWLRKRLRHK